AAGLLLFTGSDHLFLIGRDAGLVDGLARLEASERLWSARACGAHRFRRCRGGWRQALPLPATGSSCCRAFRLPVRTGEIEPGFLENWRTGGDSDFDLERSIDDQIE